MSRGVVGRLKETASHFDIEWEIPNFTSLSWDERYDSPAFSFVDTSWCIRLHQWEEKRYSSFIERDLRSNVMSADPRKGGIGIYVIRRDSGPHEVAPTVSLFVKTSYGRMQVLRETKHTFKDRDFQLGDYIPMTRMIMLVQDLDYLISGTFTVICVFKFDEEREVRGLKFVQDTPDQKFACDYKQLLLSAEGSDVTFLVKGQKFQAHRIILGARSPVFASMLSHDMKEKNTGLIDIEDCDPEHFLDFLSFLYSGSLKSITSKNVFGLYRAADKYDVRDLRSECLAFMRSHLDVDNLCEVMSLATQHDEADLMKQATDFFAKYSSIATVKWKVFMAENNAQGHLITETMNADKSPNS